MARNEQVRIDLEARDNASDKIEDVADAAERLERLDPEVEVGADTAKAEQAIDALATDARELSRVDAEIVARAKVDDARAELKQLQREMAETADTARRELGQIDVTPAADGLGRVADEGGRARSAMANMGGNVASELGAIGGAGGIAAQGLGELAEAAAEGELSMGALAKVAGPMAALAVGVELVNRQMERQRERARAAKEQIRSFTDAIRDGGDAVAAYRQQLESTGELKLPSLFGDAEDISDELGRAGVSVEQFGTAVQGGRKEMFALIEAMKAAGVGGRDLEEITEALIIGQDLYVQSTDRAKVITELLGDAADVTAEKFKRKAKATGEATDELEDLEDQVDDTKEAFDRLRDSLDYDSELDGMRDAFADALQTAAEEGAATDDQIRAIKQSIIDVAEAAGANPAVVEAQLASVTQADLWRVAGDVSRYYERNPIPLRTALARPLNIPAGFAPGTGGGGVFPTSMPVPPPVVNVTHVTQVLPRGWRGDPVALAQQTARRSGGVYRTVRR